MILALVDGKWRGTFFFNFRGFVILGTVSYAFYLWHLPIFFAVHYYGHGWAAWLRVVTAVSLTLTMTALSWLLIEKPALEWKDRLEGHGYIAASLARHPVQRRPSTTAAVNPDRYRRSPAPGGLRELRRPLDPSRSPFRGPEAGSNLGGD